MNERTLQKSVAFIDSWLEFRYGRLEIPGFVVAIAHKGDIVFKNAYGFADLEKREKLTTDHIFRIASHSKTFTATATMQLQEKGKLRIDDYAVKYIPWLKQHKDKRWQKVTIRQLMSHSAGVIRDGVDADYWQLDTPFPNAQELKKAILESDLVLDTNIQMKYSNFGYSLLGMVIEAVSGQPYNKYVKESIVSPLKLSNTGPEFEAKIANKIATAYTRRDVNKTRRPIANVDTKSMSSATGFYSTVEDLCKYFTAHMVGSKKLLDDESKKEMQRLQWQVKNSKERDAYGLGLEIEYVDERRLVGHGGGFPGHITKSMFDPKDELVVIVLTNCIDGGASEIAKGIISVINYFQNSSSARKPKHDLSKFEGRFLSLWSMVSIVSMGNKVVSVYPDTWQPFIEPEELERVDDKTLKVTKTNSFYSEGELVRFKFGAQGEVKSVNYNGGTMLPEQDWIAKQSRQKMIGKENGKK